MGDLSNSERGQIVGARLAGASVAKIAKLLGVQRATVPEVMSAYSNHGKTSAKRNSGQKSTLTERDYHTLRRIVSEDHRTTAAQVTGQQN
jgi:transposase